MLRHQPTLPSLPVPSLISTISKYLDTIRPILTDSQYATSQKLANSFLTDPFPNVLQNRLLERAHLVGDNWLSEWWNDTAYMAYRDPVVVFVSYFFVHVQDRIRKNGVQRAAELIKAMLPFRKMVEK
jgi:carnitine O-acetyltransferase